MRVLLLSRYDRLGASSRLRTMQYLPALAQAGIDVEIAPFFDDEYLRRLYAKRSTRGAVCMAFGRRIRHLLSTGSADLIWLEKEALPWVPWAIEGALIRGSAPLVTDYDDAVFHRYDYNRSPVVRRALGSKIDGVMAASTMVIAGNDYLAARARRAGAPRVEIVPTVVDINAYRVTARACSQASLAIGWIGTPATWFAYMEPMRASLVDLAAANGAILRVVGAGTSIAPDPVLDTLEWSEEREVELIQSMDIGIMPLDDSPWSRGKCGYKLIQYMACGLPVVASPVGVNSEIVEHGINGFLATSESEWREALTTLLRDAELRQRMGQAGRLKVEKHYSLQVHGSHVVRLLCEAASQGSRVR